MVGDVDFFWVGGGGCVGSFGGGSGSCVGSLISIDQTDGGSGSK